MTFAASATRKHSPTWTSAVARSASAPSPAASPVAIVRPRIAYATTTIDE